MLVNSSTATLRKNAYKVRYVAWLVEACSLPGALCVCAPISSADSNLPLTNSGSKSMHTGTHHRHNTRVILPDR